MLEKNLIQITAELRAKGFDDDFQSQDNHMLRNSAGELFLPEAMKIKEVYRLEGASDPDSMCAVYGLENMNNPHIRGIYIEPYGSMMPAAEVAISEKLIDAR